MSFIAKYRGTCEDCGDDVKPGQEASFLPDRQSIRHSPACPEPPSLTPAQLCPRCFLELPRTGVCGVCDG